MSLTKAQALSCASASVLRSGEQRASEATLPFYSVSATLQRASERRTSEFARAQAKCDEAEQDKRDLLEVAMKAATPAAMALAFNELDEKKARAALASREKGEKQKAKDAAGVANSGEQAPPTSPADGRPTMANIDQVREGDRLADERQAIASIAHYSSANPEAPPADITDTE